MYRIASISLLSVQYYSLVKSSRLGILFAEIFLPKNLIILIGIGLFRFPISFWVSFGDMCPSNYVSIHLSYWAYEHKVVCYFLNFRKMCKDYHYHQLLILAILFHLLLVWVGCLLIFSFFQKINLWYYCFILFSILLISSLVKIAFIFI